MGVRLFRRAPTTRLLPRPEIRSLIIIGIIIMEAGQ